MEALAAFHAALIDPSAPPPANTLSPRGETDPLRFAVYRNNVHVGLVNALAAKFPVTRMVLGEEFFTGMARAYVGEHKPDSPLLMRYGASFADYAGQFPNTGTVPYLADLARLENLWSEAYNAAEAAPLGIAAISARPPETLATLRLEPHPAARLLVSAFPVGSIWGAHQVTPVAPITQWQAETVVLARPGAQVGVHVLPTHDAPFAHALFTGQSLGEAVGAATDPLFDFGTALVGLLSLGTFSAIREDI